MQEHPADAGSLLARNALAPGARFAQAARAPRVNLAQTLHESHADLARNLHGAADGGSVIDLRKTARSAILACMTKLAEHIVHPLEPVFNAQSRVLVLGTMPSPASRAAQFYYGHPQNRFWRVLAALWNEPVPAENHERAAFILRHHLALWDVLAACDIEGAADASIRNAHPNDLTRVVDHAPISAVFTTGTKAAQLYQKLCATSFPHLTHHALPSTSAANARMSLSDLTRAYRSLREAAETSVCTQVAPRNW